MKTAFQPAEPQPMLPPRERKARHHSRTGRLFTVAFLLASSWGGAVVFVCGAFLLWQHNRPVHGWLALAGLALIVGGRVGAFVLGRNVTCHLCHGPLLQEKRCPKHARALRLAPFSYRSTAAATILGCGTFRCMYCGTDYRLRK